jgi:Ca2+-binding EF-hand superfamily protein
MEGEEKRQAWDTFTKWWSEYVLWGKEEITEAEFIKKQNDAFKADKAKFIERARKCEEIICPFVDAAHHGFVTEDELLIIFKAGGHGNEELDKQFFAALEPVDGKIPMQKFIDMWTQYLTCDDKSKPDLVVKAFAGGI